ncbi:MAG: hypothetical protein M1457_14445 [bacterium]|nr:hypothetical protein [bacterium]
MRAARRRLSVLLFTAALAVGAASAAQGAEDFKADLGLATELIDGGRVGIPTVPPGAPELTTYPIPPEQPRRLLTEVPGKSFRQVEPVPERRAWWKYPIYAAVGLPRDLADSIFGALSFVPILDLPVVYLGYEVVPTQVLLRDPRDWHRWPGRRNSLDHGMIDSDGWGWFPSAHAWHFTYPSKRLQRLNQAINEGLRAQMQALNREIERENQAISNRQRDARTKALAAIDAGDGREAALRIIPYQQAYALDEGAFSLFATALGLYGKDAPRWVANLLWHELDTAQPRQLIQAEKLLTATAGKHPDNVEMTETLIYVRLLLGNNDAALAAAQGLLARQPDDPAIRRLVFETALSARNPPLARQMWQALRNGPPMPDRDRVLAEARLDLLAGEAKKADGSLRQLQQLHPEDPYLDYCLGVAQLDLADRSPDPAATYRGAFELLEKAALQGTDPAIHLRAGKALAYARGLMVGIGKRPELFKAPAAPPAGALQ